MRCSIRMNIVYNSFVDGRNSLIRFLTILPSLKLCEIAFCIQEIQGNIVRYCKALVIHFKKEEKTIIAMFFIIFSNDLCS